MTTAMAKTQNRVFIFMLLNPVLLGIENVSDQSQKKTSRDKKRYSSLFLSIGHIYYWQIRPLFSIPMHAWSHFFEIFQSSRFRRVIRRWSRWMRRGFQVQYRSRGLSREGARPLFIDLRARKHRELKAWRIDEGRRRHHLFCECQNRIRKKEPPLQSRQSDSDV